MNEDSNSSYTPNGSYGNQPQHPQPAPQPNYPTTPSPKPNKKRLLIVSISALVLLAVGILLFSLTRASDSSSSNSGVSIVEVTPQIPDGWAQHELPFDDQTFVFYIPAEWDVSKENYLEPSGAYADAAFNSPSYGSLFIDGYMNTDEGARVIVRVSETREDNFDRVVKNAKDRENTRDSFRKLRNVEETSINNLNAITYVQGADLSRVVHLHGSDYSVEFKLFSSFEYDEARDTLDYDDTHLDDLYKIVESFHIAQ